MFYSHTVPANSLQLLFLFHQQYFLLWFPKTPSCYWNDNQGSHVLKRYESSSRDHRLDLYKEDVDGWMSLHFIRNGDILTTESQTRASEHDLNTTQHNTTQDHHLLQSMKLWLSSVLSDLDGSLTKGN